MRLFAGLLGSMLMTLGFAQVRPVYSAIESHVTSAQVICVGKVAKIESVVVNQYPAIQLTIKVSETLKGHPISTVIAHRFEKEAKQHYEAAQHAGVEFVWFVPKDTARIDYCLDFSFSEYRSIGGLALGMDFTVLRTRQEVISRVRQFLRENPDSKPGDSLLAPLPGRSMTGLVDFIIPHCRWTETLAVRMITNPDSFIFGPPLGNPVDAATPATWKQTKDGMLRVHGLMLLKAFKSPSNIRLAQRYLQDPSIAMGGSHGEPIKTHYWVRDAAYRLLRYWKVEVAKPMIYGPVIADQIGLFRSDSFGLDRAFD